MVSLFLAFPPLDVQSVCERAVFSTILGSLEEVWGTVFKQEGQKFKPPKIVLYQDKVKTGEGLIDNRFMFYSTVDFIIYVDPIAFQKALNISDIAMDFRVAIAVAHDFGHHVQCFQRGAENMDRIYLQNPIAIEQEADYLAGAWVNFACQLGHISLDSDDIEFIESVMIELGEDVRARKAGIVPDPSAYTHGTGQQRAESFMSGFATGKTDFLFQ